MMKKRNIATSSCASTSRVLSSVWYSFEPRQNQGRGLVDHKLVKAPSNFIAGSPKAALLFWFFGGFRCGVPLFIVMLVIY